MAKAKYKVKAGKKKVVRVKFSAKGAKVLRKKKPAKLTVVLNPGQGVKSVKKKLKAKLK